MHLRTLGNLALEGVDFPQPKLLLLLSYLSVAGPQPRGRLARLFWPDATDGRNRLSVSLSRIHKHLPGVLDLDDRHVSTRLTNDANALLAALADGRKAEAIAAYRGPFLDDVVAVGVSEELLDWIHATRDELARRVQHAHLDLAEILAADARFERAADHAESALAGGALSLLDPADLARLHTLLVASGSPRAVEVREEADAFELDLVTSQGQARERLAPVRSPGSIGSTLPHGPTRLIGRERELAELEAMLRRDHVRLVTLVGPGGIGKSSLALRVASDASASGRYEGGVAFVELEEVPAPEGIPFAIADAFGEADAAGGAPLEAVARRIGASRFLLVLDNFEDLVAGAEVVATLLDRCTRLQLVVTSREALELEAEWVVPVAGLSYPEGSAIERMGDAAAHEQLRDVAAHTPGATLLPSADPPSDVDPTLVGRWSALALFEERARKVHAGFRIGPEDVASVTAICRACHGSPLALELAAGWAGAMASADIAEEIAADIDFLSTRRRDAGSRHRSIRHVFEQSWRRLSDEERRAFRRLSVFRGGFDRGGARAVARADARVLAGLVAKSFLMLRSGGRYERHPLLHQFGSEKLAADAAERAEMAARHAKHMHDLALSARPRINAVAAGSWMRRLESDHANLHAALTWARDECRADVMLDMVESLSEYWVWRGYLDEALHWAKEIVAMGDQHGDPERHVAMLLRTSYLCLLHADYESPRELLDASLVIARRIGSVRAEARTWSHRGIVAVYRGDYPTARSHYQRALAQAEAGGHADVVARVLNNLGDVFFFEGDHVKASAYYARCVELEREVGDRQMVSNVLGSLAMALLYRGDVEAAQRSLRESVSTVTSMGITFSIPPALEQYALLASACGRWSEGARLWGASEALRERLRTPLEPFARPTRDAWLRAAVERLGVISVHEAHDHGRRWPAEYAMAWALGTDFVRDMGSETPELPPFREPGRAWDGGSSGNQANEGSTSRDQN
ncbi:MAG: tetratricopeptide repeat protein [Trueperaceae bacterium]